MNRLESVEKAQLRTDIPDFAPGDTVRVAVKVVEGERTRTQAFEGVCIARRGSGVSESFTVRKISFGEGVERVFPLYSPMIDSIKIVRRGKVRRAKLYYLRGLRGKAARIAEKQDHRPADESVREDRLRGPSYEPLSSAASAPSLVWRSTMRADLPRRPRR